MLVLSFCAFLLLDFVVAFVVGVCVCVCLFLLLPVLSSLLCFGQFLLLCFALFGGLIMCMALFCHLLGLFAAVWLLLCWRCVRFGVVVDVGFVLHFDCLLVWAFCIVWRLHLLAFACLFWLVVCFAF